MEKKETWKPIDGYEGRYSISNFGQVKRHATKVYVPSRKIFRHLKEEILYHKSKTGYCILSPFDSPKGLFVHRLVAAAFIPNPKNLPYINHINGIKDDNRVENLEWVDHLGNMQHAFETGLVPSGEKSFRSKLTNSQVLEIKEILTNNPDYNQSELARKYNVVRSTINGIFKNRKWKTVNKEQKS